MNTPKFTPALPTNLADARNEYERAVITHPESYSRLPTAADTLAESCRRLNWLASHGRELPNSVPVWGDCPRKSRTGLHGWDADSVIVQIDNDDLFHGFEFVIVPA